MNTIPVVVSTLNVEDLTKYPDSFIEFADGNNLKYPKLTTGNGQALCAMLLTSGHHWSRPECDEFVKKFNISIASSARFFIGVADNNNILKFFDFFLIFITA